MSKRSLVLLILDGWGIGGRGNTNPIFEAKPETIEFIKHNFPSGSLQASGISAGLPWNEEGNSEAGHLNIGTGRIVYQYYPRISLAVRDGSFMKNENLKQAFGHCARHHSTAHFAGVISQSNVHASFEHLQSLMDFAEKEGVLYRLHLLTDGIDSPPRTALKLVKKVPQEKIATLMGRFYGMDKDKHWDRIQRAYDALSGNCPVMKNPAEHIEDAYQKNLTDEYLPPARSADYTGLKENDSLIFFNFREDGIRQLASVFADPAFKAFHVALPLNLRITTLTSYSAAFAVPVAFPPQDVANCLSQVLADQHKIQFRVAESYKSAHITYFFNGLREEPFPQEYRVIIPSLSDPHPEAHPALQINEITARAVSAVEEGTFDFILVNFANPDRIAHTGNYPAALATIRIVDQKIKELMEACLRQNAILLITADHGNIERMFDPRTGEPESQHDISPVPIYIVAKEYAWPRTDAEASAGERTACGILADVAPTILELMHLPQPKEMTGRSLLQDLTK